MRDVQKRKQRFFLNYLDDTYWDDVLQRLVVWLRSPKSPVYSSDVMKSADGWGTIGTDVLRVGWGVGSGVG